MTREPVDAYKLQDEVKWFRFKIERLFKAQDAIFERLKKIEDTLEDHLTNTHNGWGRTHDEETSQPEASDDTDDLRSEKAG